MYLDTMDINCEKPTIIVNPYLKDLILQHKNYTIRGKEYLLNDYQAGKFYYDFPILHFLRRFLRLIRMR